MLSSTVYPAAFLLAFATAVLPQPLAAQEPPRVLAMITTAEPQVQGMAFVLLDAMRQQGTSVEVMLCGPAADLARRDPPSGPGTPLRPRNITPAQMLAGLVKAGTRVEVCALYLPNAGIGPEGLIEGVKPAQPPEMAKRMTDRSAIVLPF